MASASPPTGMSVLKDLENPMKGKKVTRITDIARKENKIMKAFTDLDQSRKLAEILSTESADMCWTPFDEKWDAYLGAPNPDAIKKEIPCWSLAALLNIFPASTLDSSDAHYYRLYCNEKFTEWYDNPIDACVEMINRLHEQIIHDFNNS